MDQQTLQNLNNQEKIAEFKNTIDDIIISDMVGDAKKILVGLESLFSHHPDFGKADYSLFSVFQKFYISLKFVIIFELPEKEILDLISNHFDFVFKYPEYDLERKIKYKISSINDLEERDEFKAKIRQALLNNKMSFGQGKIMVSGIEQRATVSTWLKDCYMKLGVGPINSLKINEYLVNDPNTKNLSVDDKAKLKILLNFFEKIKVSSQEDPLFEESFVAILPNEDIVLISSGQPEKINQEIVKSAKSLSSLDNGLIDKQVLPTFSTSFPAQPTATQPASIKSEPISFSPLEELEQSLKNYSESSFEHKALRQEISRLKKSELTKAQYADAKK